jgi:hypothetical protein
LEEEAGEEAGEEDRREDGHEAVESSSLSNDESNLVRDYFTTGPEGALSPVA